MRKASLALTFAFLALGRGALSLADEPALSSLDFSATGESFVNGEAFTKKTNVGQAEVLADVERILVGGNEDSYVLYLRPLEGHRVGTNGSMEKIPVQGDARPYAPESNWKMFDAEGNATNDPRYAVRVILPAPIDVSSALFEASWNECQGPIGGNYAGLPCNSQRGLSDDYLAFLQSHYLSCVNAGQSAAGQARATSVHIVHDGTLADPRHSHRSLHAVGRAIDVLQLTATSADGKLSYYDFQQTNTDHRLSHSCKPAASDNCKFYEAFRACWHELHVARKCPPRKDGPLGTIGWEDSAHIAHHLHTSYPFCPNSKGYFITKNGKKK